MDHDDDDDDLVKKIKETSKEGLEDDFENVEDEKYNEHHGVSKYIWISDVYDELYELLDYYSEIEHRLKWVSMVDIMYGPRSYKTIPYDEDIQDFADELFDLIYEIFQRIKNKKLVIRDDDKHEFDSLETLNRDDIYSRIICGLEQWFVF